MKSVKIQGNLIKAKPTGAQAGEGEEMRLRQGLSLAVALGVTIVLFPAPSRADSASSSETIYENSAGSPLLPLINSARSTLDIEIYEMDDPEVHQALSAALARRVRVRVIKDPTPVGGSCRVFVAPSNSDSADCASQKRLVSEVRASGGTYIEFNKTALCAQAGGKCFEHGKLLIADRTQTLISTGNFNTSNLCSRNERVSTCNRDYTVVSQDPSVAQMVQAVFETDLAGRPYDTSALASKVSSVKLTISPYSLSPLVDFIASAKKSIQIQNQYLKDPTLNQAILSAAARGVQIQIMVASACSFGTPSVGDEKQWNKIYAAFDQAGIQTRIFTRAIQVRGVSGYLHAKAIVVDGVRAWVGSVNGSTMSLTNNREYGIFVNRLSEVQKLAQVMYADFVDKNSESWKDSLACKNDPQPTSGDEGGFAN